MRGAWIEILSLSLTIDDISTSLPVRGAWIEMPYVYISGSARNGRSPCGERGLKCLHAQHAKHRGGRRSPCGERGLKLLK